MILTGGSDWSIEFGTPDCQHGWAVTKGGTAQSIGCYLTKAEAEKALEGLKNEEIDLLGEEVRTSKSPQEYAESHVNKSLEADSFWNGVFAPVHNGSFDPNFHSQNQDDRYYFPSKATYENDGKPSAGYGNRSSNDATPQGNNFVDRTTQPGNRTWE